MEQKKIKRVFKVTLEVPEIINYMPVDIFLEFIFKALPWQLKQMLQCPDAIVEIKEEIEN